MAQSNCPKASGFKPSWNAFLILLKQKAPIFMAMGVVFLHASFIEIHEREGSSEIHCTDGRCKGHYSGLEFINGSDVAHQFSNQMSHRVGEKLKQLYDEAKYSKVDFSNISMSTVGMGSGKVTYSLDIPFVSVSEKCEAYTSFDHCGGWNHAPAIQSRKKQLQKALLKGEELFISDLKTTKEGLQEYWIQWKNKHKQAECAKK